MAEGSEGRSEELQKELAELRDELAKERQLRQELETKLELSEASGSTDTEELLKRTNEELRDLTENLDKIVRRRTQALAESEAQLLKSNEELKRMNLTKREFVSIAAHELRTPLTSMVGYLELMGEGSFGKMPKSFEKPMLSVRRNALRLRRLVDDMLDVSRIEADRMVLKKTRCSLPAIATAVIEELHPLAETKNQTVVSQVDDCPDIEADEDKIHQVLANLLSNAVRYCPVDGKILVTIDQAPKKQYPGAWARLRVRDNGPGIAAKDLDAIFEPFSDINPAKHHTSRGPDAAGLGLYIARGLVDLHEGVVSVASTPGEFTEFTVLLPGIEE